jgi:hypothetical protein
MSVDELTRQDYQGAYRPPRRACQNFPEAIGAGPRAAELRSERIGRMHADVMLAAAVLRAIVAIGLPVTVLRLDRKRGKFDQT